MKTPSNVAATAKEPAGCTCLVCACANCTCGTDPKNADCNCEAKCTC